MGWNISSTNPERRPFKAYLDVGLVRTTTGNRVFGAMKGACDGGLNIPHNERRFPGCRMDNAEEHLEHIMGVHVQEYYDLLKGENPTAFKKQFSQWEKALGGKKFEDIYKAAHAGIRKSPDHVKKARKNAPVRKVVQAKPTLIQAGHNGKKWLSQMKIGSQMRHERVQAKIAKIGQEIAAM